MTGVCLVVDGGVADSAAAAAGGNLSAQPFSRDPVIYAGNRTRHRRAGVDIGGTFTDLIMVDDRTGDFVVNKTLSTPQRSLQAIETALTEALLPGNIPLDEVATIVHGTTLVTNALIERKGDPAALLTTRGFATASKSGARAAMTCTT